MSNLAIFIYEWKHLIRHPFKVAALFLFVTAGVYALHNGASLYHEQVAEIEQISEKADESRQKTIAYFDNDQIGPEDRPWVDVTTPFWAIWYMPVNHFKYPSPAMVYSIGQAEQYGYYKRITFWSSPYDADMAEEIANPERLQLGTLDFSFVVLYLLPLLLLTWLFNIKGAEADRGFLPLIYNQTGPKRGWLMTRIAFYGTLLVLVVLGLMLYGALLTNVFANSSTNFWPIFLLILSYLLLWIVVFALILYSGSGSIGNTLKMVGVWLLFTLIVPGTVHQWVSIRQPANLMTEFIDAQRDESNQLFEEPDSVLQAHLNDLFPEIPNSPVYRDSTKRNLAMNRSSSALANELVKKSYRKIESSNDTKNHLIRSSHWFNPLTFFQNQLNRRSGTHYQNYQDYRSEVQSLIDQQIRALVLDTWDGVVVDKERYLEYGEVLE